RFAVDVERMERAGDLVADLRAGLELLLSVGGGPGQSEAEGDDRAGRPQTMQHELSPGKWKRKQRKSGRTTLGLQERARRRESGAASGETREERRASETMRGPREVGRKAGRNHRSHFRAGKGGDRLKIEEDPNRGGRPFTFRATVW